MCMLMSSRLHLQHKPPNTLAQSNKRLSLHRYSQATLATGITRAAVACPPSEDPDEWLAVHSACVMCAWQLDITCMKRVMTLTGIRFS